MKHLRDFVSSVPEYRRTGKGNFRHKLEDMLMLVILGRLSKCITRADILQFGKQHLKRLQSQGMFRHGLPSEATLCRVSQGIDDEKMAGCLAAFAEIFRKEAAVPGLAEIICIDGIFPCKRTPYIYSILLAVTFHETNRKSVCGNIDFVVVHFEIYLVLAGCVFKLLMCHCIMNYFCKNNIFC